jgi:pyruvate,water dikinase
MVMKKVVDISEKYVKWLSELSKDSGSVAGGKGANLAEMFNAGFPVPPAFCITAQSFDIFLKKANLKQAIQEIIERTNVDDTNELEDNARKIRTLIVNSEMPDDMETEILEAYEILSTDFSNKRVLEPSKISKSALDILKTSYEPVFVAVRSSATAEDLAAASFAGQQDTYTNIKGNKQLIEAVKKCFASLYTARAVYYRHKKGFSENEVLLSVVVQKMINSDKSGVIFTKNPMNHAEEVVIEAVFGLGEGIVSGKIRPDHYVVSNELEIKKRITSEKKTAIVRESSGSEKVVTLTPEKSRQQVLSDSEIKNLANLAMKIERHYKKPQDIEFAVESGILYIVQSRPITTLEKTLVKNVELGENFILSGLAASPGVASGVVKIIHSMNDLSKIQAGDVLVTKMTNPDMVVAMQRCSAIVTDEGGATAHAAIVSREMGIPCVVGTDKATETLKDGMIITVDGSNGRVYEGKLGQETKKKEVMPIVQGTKTKIKVMVDLPDFAERAAKSESESVGLLRLEGIIAESGKHPLYFIENKNPEEYSKIIEEGVRRIAEHFKEVWIRTSDIRTDEYQHLKGAPKQVEVNPMLGFHGIRFSLKHLPIMEAELSAIMRVAEKYPEKKFGIMFPQVISENEMAEAYKIFKKYQKENIIIGTMIETPAAVQVIRGICKYAKFISFGTNDLTQYTLAIDRGNSECQYLYDEMHPAILSQLKRVIEICKEYHVQTSICGQAGSKKEMVEFLVRNGIDSLSVNADMAAEISQYVKELEESRAIGKNKNSENHDSNMAKKAKILPIDDLSEVKKKEEEKVQEVEEEKKEKQEEKKAEEYPEFEIGFDPFAEQKN